MNGDVAIHLAMNAMLLAFELSLPFLAASLIIGLVVSILQAATQIQEITLTFVPKMVATGVVLVIAGPWMLDRVTSYTTQLFVEIPQLVGT
jgi:flagellar biosynthetic protein FliQ